jgi:hypothetical protein
MFLRGILNGGGFFLCGGQSFCRLFLFNYGNVGCTDIFYGSDIAEANALGITVAQITLNYFSVNIIEVHGPERADGNASATSNTNVIINLYSG